MNWIEWLDTKLETGWKASYKWLSVQLTVLTGVAVTAWELVPGLQGMIPEKWFHGLVIVCTVLIVIVRLKKQGSNDKQT